MVNYYKNTTIMNTNYSTKNTKLFNEVFKKQFGYYPLRKNGKLLKEKDVNEQNLNKLQLMGYIPFVVEVLEKYRKPNFRDVVKLKGSAHPKSCGTLGGLYHQIGFIDYVGKTMIQGKNFNKFLTTKWDWFEINGSLGLIKGEMYPLKKLHQLSWVNRYNNDFVSPIPKSLQTKISSLINKWGSDKIEKQWIELMGTKVMFK